MMSTFLVRPSKKEATTDLTSEHPVPDIFMERQSRSSDETEESSPSAAYARSLLVKHNMKKAHQSRMANFLTRPTKRGSTDHTLAEFLIRPT